MKLYRFNVHNMRNGFSFVIEKPFLSAYYADRWATRVSITLRNSPYIITLRPGEETEI